MMAMPSRSPRDGGDLRLSVFARTLEDLLRAHGDTPLSQLDNLHERPGEQIDPDEFNPDFPGRELVHREKVRRLELSLSEPGTLSILSRDDLERIYRYFAFSEEERRRVRVAMLATQIQRLVYERSTAIDNPLERALVALHAAELLLPTLEDGLRGLGESGNDSDLRRIDGMVAAQAVGAMTMAGGTISQGQPDERRLYAALASALDAIDRATLALNLSYSAPGTSERLERARAARDAFSDALKALDELEDAVKASEPWRMWHAEARRGYDEADERIIDVGG